MQMKKGIDVSQGPPPQRTSSRAINFIISQIGEARRWSDMIVALRDLTRHNVVVVVFGSYFACSKKKRRT